MSLPAGTPKNKNLLRTQADGTYKDNGGSDTTKTQGINVRQYIADLLESVVFIQEDFLEIRNFSIKFF